MSSMHWLAAAAAAGSWHYCGVLSFGKNCFVCHHTAALQHTHRSSGVRLSWPRPGCGGCTSGAASGACHRGGPPVPCIGLRVVKPAATAVAATALAVLQGVSACATAGMLVCSPSLLHCAVLSAVRFLQHAPTQIELDKCFHSAQSSKEHLQHGSTRCTGLRTLSHRRTQCVAVCGRPTGTAITYGAKQARLNAW